LVWFVNPMGRILVRWQRFRNNLKIMCLPICNRLYFHARPAYISMYILCILTHVQVCTQYTNWPVTTSERCQVIVKASFSASLPGVICSNISTICLYMYIYVYRCIHVYSCMCMYGKGLLGSVSSSWQHLVNIWIYISINICVYRYMYIHIYIYIHTYIYIYISIYICVYTSIYLL